MYRIKYNLQLECEQKKVIFLKNMTPATAKTAKLYNHTKNLCKLKLCCISISITFHNNSSKDLP